MDNFPFQQSVYGLFRLARECTDTAAVDTVIAEGFRVPIGTLSTADHVLEHRPPIPCPQDPYPTGSVKLPFCFYGATLTQEEIMT